MGEFDPVPASTRSGDEPFVNAVVELRIPLDDVAVTDDSETKLKAAVAAFEACPAADMEQATVIRFEDVRVA